MLQKIYTNCSQSQSCDTLVSHDKTDSQKDIQIIFEIYFLTCAVIKNNLSSAKAPKHLLYFGSLPLIATYFSNLRSKIYWMMYKIECQSVKTPAELNGPI